MNIGVRPWFIAVIAGGIAFISLCVPFATRAQTSEEVQTRLSALIQQLIEIEAQIAQLLGTNPSLTSSPFSLGAALPPIAQQIAAPSIDGRISSILLRELGSLTAADANSIDLSGVRIESKALPSAAPSPFSCRYYGAMVAEGARREGDACPGAQCEAPGPQLLCKKGEWVYTTGVSVCIPPGFLLESDAQRAYRIALGCAR